LCLQLCLRLGRGLRRWLRRWLRRGERRRLGMVRPAQGGSLVGRRLMILKMMVGRPERLMMMETLVAARAEPTPELRPPEGGLHREEMAVAHPGIMAGGLDMQLLLQRVDLAVLLLELLPHDLDRILVALFGAQQRHVLVLQPVKLLALGALRLA